MRFFQRGTITTVFVIYFVLWLAAIGGYIANIVKLIGHIHDTSFTVLTIFRIVGVVAAPLGAILGFVPG